MRDEHTMRELEAEESRLTVQIDAQSDEVNRLIERRNEVRAQLGWVTPFRVASRLESVLGSGSGGVRRKSPLK